MSVEAIVWALNHAPCTSSSQKLVLFALANHARPDGTSAFPSVGTIGRYTLLSERTIRSVLDQLEELRVILPCDPRIVAAYISRVDRRPQGWNLSLWMVSGVQEVQVVDERGATDDTDGVQLLPNGVQLTHERGAVVAPKPLLNQHEPLIEPSEASRLCEVLAELMVANGCRRPAITQKWISDMDKLIRIDLRDALEVEACIRWSQADDFWKSNILSPAKLRAKFDTMRLRAMRDQQSAEPRGYGGIRDFLEAQ